MTQRTNHSMALLDVAIRDEQLHVWHRHHPDEILELPLTVAPSASAETLLVTIWDSIDVQAVPVSAEADQWFTNVLSKPCRLVLCPKRPTGRSTRHTHELMMPSVLPMDIRICLLGRRRSMH